MRPRTVIYIGNFFFSLFIALITYILLPYISSFMPEAYAGLVISGGALAAVILFPLMPRLVERYGAQRFLLIFAVIEIFALLALAATPGPITGILLVAVAIALQPFIAYELDILLETTVIEEHTTGRVRAIFLTAWNIAALAGPLLVTDLAVLQRLLVLLVVEGDVAVFGGEGDDVRGEHRSGAEHDESYCGYCFLHFCAPFLFEFFAAELW